MKCAIQTKYLGWTNTKPARIKAWVTGGHSITIPTEDWQTDHINAALALVKVLNWKGFLMQGEIARRGVE